MKKIGLLVLCVLMAGTFVFAKGGAQSGVKKIGIAVPTADHGWTGGVGWWADYSVKEMTSKYAGQIEFRVVHSANPTAQVADVENLMTWGMDILVVLPHESAPLYTTVKTVHDSGVRCIVVDRGIEPDNFGYVYVAGDNYGMGVESGKWLAAQMKKEGLTNYIAQGGLPILIDTQRMQGFFEEMDKESSLVNLEGKDKYQFANFSPQVALSLTENQLQQYPKIDAIFCQDDDAMIGTLQAIKESGRTDIKIVLGGAGSKAAFEMIKARDPLVRATTLYHPSMISDGIQYAVDVALGNKSDSFHNGTKGELVTIPSALIDISNVDKYYNPDSSF